MNDATIAALLTVLIVCFWLFATRNR